MEFGLWKFIQVGFTWSFGPFCWPMWSHFFSQRRLPGNSVAAVLWRKVFPMGLWELDYSLSPLSSGSVSPPDKVVSTGLCRSPVRSYQTYTITHTRRTIPPFVPTSCASSGPSAARVNRARQRLNCALSRSAHVGVGVLSGGLPAQGLI